MASGIEQPGKGTFNHPAALDRVEATNLSFHDLELAFVGALRPQTQRCRALPAYPLSTQSLRTRLTPSVVRCGDHYAENQTRRIDQHMTFTPLDPLAAILALGRALGDGFHTLTIHTTRRGFGVTTLTLALVSAQGIHQSAPYPLLTPVVEVPVHGAPAPKVFG
jgi:hypothetical protein